MKIGFDRLEQRSSASVRIGQPGHRKPRVHRDLSYAIEPILYDSVRMSGGARRVIKEGVFEDKRGIERYGVVRSDCDRDRRKLRVTLDWKEPQDRMITQVEHIRDQKVARGVDFDDDAPRGNSSPKGLLHCYQRGNLSLVQGDVDELLPPRKSSRIVQVRSEQARMLRPLPRGIPESIPIDPFERLECET